MASSLKKLSCDISVDDPVSSGTDDSFDLDDDLDLDFSGHLTLRGATGFEQEVSDDEDEDENFNTTRRSPRRRSSRPGRHEPHERG